MPAAMLGTARRNAARLWGASASAHPLVGYLALRAPLYANEGGTLYDAGNQPRETHMREGITFHYVCTVIERGEKDRPPFMQVCVQVWDGERHVSTVKLADIVDVVLSEHVNINTVETFALAANRVVGRALAQIHMDAIDAESLHERRSFG